jgi:hypothetical protein
MLVGLPWYPQEHELRIRGILAATLIAALAACSDNQPTSPTMPLDTESSISDSQRLAVSPAVDTVEVGKAITLSVDLPKTATENSVAAGGDSATPDDSTKGAGVHWGTDDPTIASARGGRIVGRKPGTVNIVAFAGKAIGYATVVVRAASDSASTSEDKSNSGVGSLYSGYSATSPHWSHIRTLATDFYYNWTPTERSWAGQHFDAALSGDGAAWRAVNPGVTQMPYTLFWTVLTPGSSSRPSLSSSYYDDMKRWYRAHPEYRLEDAFLHASTPKRSSTRLRAHIWDSNRWMINPSDPGARAYTVDRYRRLAKNVEGVFIDEASSGDILPRVRGAVESSRSEYETDYTSLLAEMKRSLGGKMIMLNTAEYMKEFDRENAAAAGAVHLELFNNPMVTQMDVRWDWVEDLRSLGVTVDMVSPYPSEWADEHTRQYPKGNYAKSGQRLQMWELASYYMVVGQSPEGLFFHLKAPDWNTPFSKYWFKAPEANIGHPVSARRQRQKGTDPTGQAYSIYEREFDRALVLIRTQAGWGAQSYRDGTGVEVKLPSGESWLPLRADGSLGAAVTKVELRNSESLILVKKSRI